MRRLLKTVAGIAFVAVLGVLAAGPAAAASPSDKPGVTVGRLTV